MSTHDGAYKHIFSHAQIVRDLLTGFVRESWVGLLDLDTLELTKNSYVTDDLRDRADDLNNALAEMIRLERSPTPAELQAIVARLTRRLAEPRHDSLRRALVVWLNRVVLRRLVPGERIDEVHDLQEMGAMLAERVVEWTENWKQQGLQEGRLKGRQEGRLKGEAAVLTRLLTRRFGPLDASVRSRLDQATLEELERWSDRILDAATLDEIFA